MLTTNWKAHLSIYRAIRRWSITLFKWNPSFNYHHVKLKSCKPLNYDPFSILFWTTRSFNYIWAQNLPIAFMQYHPLHWYKIWREPMKHTHTHIYIMKLFPNQVGTKDRLTRSLFRLCLCLSKSLHDFK